MRGPIQRLNYHTGLFLEETEFTLEQSYHVIMRQLINYGLFRPGVLHGMALHYSGGVLTVRAGMAIDEVMDPDFGLIGRELLLLQDSDPVDLSSFSAGNTVWITVGYDSALEVPKPPTSPTPSRYTQKVSITAHDADPGPGTERILLGQITIGIDSTSDAVQKATLRLTGAVAPVSLTGITVDPPNLTVSVGATGTLVARGSFSDGSTRPLTAADGLMWSSSDTSRATVSPAGVVTGVAPGVVTITAQAGGFSATSTVTVVSAVAPVIKSIVPTSQIVGGTVTIRGSDIRSGTLSPGDPATGTTIRFVDPGNSANSVTAVNTMVLTDVVPATGPQRIQVTIPPKGGLPNLVNIVLTVGGVPTTSPQPFTFV